MLIIHFTIEVIENIRCLMHKYGIKLKSLMIWINPLVISYAVSKVFKYNIDHIIIDDVYNANVTIDLCHERDNYHYPLGLHNILIWNRIIFFKVLCCLCTL